MLIAIYYYIIGSCKLLISIIILIITKPKYSMWHNKFHEELFIIFILLYILYIDEVTVSTNINKVTLRCQSYNHNFTKIRL